MSDLWRIAYWYALEYKAPLISTSTNYLHPSPMKFKNTCISTESKTFYPHEECRTYVKKRYPPDSDVMRYVITITGLGPLYFQLAPISFRCPQIYCSQSNRNDQDLAVLLKFTWLTSVQRKLATDRIAAAWRLCCMAWLCYFLDDGERQDWTSPLCNGCRIYTMSQKTRH